MEKKKLQNISIAALIISALPFATLIPVFLQIVLPDGLRTVWGGVNIVCAVTGLCLGLGHFDSWAASFGKTRQQAEYLPCPH